MGFALIEFSFILHTNTWTYKWTHLADGQKVALALGLNHLNNFGQIFGTVRKVPQNDGQFDKLEQEYFANHPDSVFYKKGLEGILLIVPDVIRLATVADRHTTFSIYTGCGNLITE